MAIHLPQAVQQDLVDSWGENYIFRIPEFHGSCSRQVLLLKANSEVVCEQLAHARVASNSSPAAIVWNLAPNSSNKEPSSNLHPPLPLLSHVTWQASITELRLIAGGFHFRDAMYPLRALPCILQKSSRCWTCLGDRIQHLRSAGWSPALIPRSTSGAEVTSHHWALWSCRTWNSLRPHHYLC